MWPDRTAIPEMRLVVPRVFEAWLRATQATPPRPSSCSRMSKRRAPSSGTGIVSSKAPHSLTAICQEMRSRMLHLWDKNPTRNIQNWPSKAIGHRVQSIGRTIDKDHLFNRASVDRTVKLVTHTYLSSGVTAAPFQRTFPLWKRLMLIFIKNWKINILCRIGINWNQHSPKRKLLLVFLIVEGRIWLFCLQDNHK